MQKKILFTSLLSFIVLFSKAQTGVFKTYEDYKSGKMEKMDDIKQWITATFGVALIKFISPDGNTITYKPSEYWGFLYKGNLFRSKGNHDYVCLIDSGKVYYYENGHAWISLIKDGSKGGRVPETGRQSYAFLSKDIASEIYALPASIMQKKEYKKFRDEYPEYEDLYSCMGESLVGTITEIRECIEKCNHSSLSKKETIR